MGDYRELFGAVEGRGESYENEGTPSSFAQVLDLYVVHFIMALLFVAGGIMLIDRYAVNQEKANSTANDFFYAMGALALFANVLFIVGLIVAWIMKRADALRREDIEIHWLHAFSIFACVTSVIWAIYALILTFGSTLTGPTSDDVQITGYFIVIFCAVYFTYLTLRGIFGFIGKGKPPSGIESKLGDKSAEELLRALRNNGATTAVQSSQPLFGGAGGAIPFGGIDLSGLQSSSMNTLPPSSQAAHTAPCGQQGMYPMMMFPPMMMASPGQATAASCSPDPNAVHIS